jgi:hypothetical protein
MLAFLVLVSLGLPLFSVWRLTRLDEPSRLRWLAKALDALALAAVVLLVARWDVAGVHSRTALLLLLAAAFAWSLARHARRPWRAPGRWPRPDAWATGLSLALLGGMVGWIAAGLLPVAGARPLACPLADGRFLVAQGGANGLLNHHVGHRAQHHAADIVAVSPAGFRAAGLLPSDPGRYAIHGAAVVSPCAGTVAAVRDGLPDLRPPTADPDNAAGNHLVLACGDLRVEIAHLRAGSLAVAPGDPVAPGTPLAEVGNSGNSTEPHLHLHATDVAGTAVPITLGGRTPARGRQLDC